MKEALGIKTKKAADTNHDTAKNGIEKVARKNMLASIASTNNTVVQNHKIMTVYKTIGVRIGGEGSSYCKNKGDKHTSNSVYFCMNSSGMYHKCFSRKDTIGVSGKYCKAFAWTAEPIPIAFRRFLFKEEFDLNVRAVESDMRKRGLF